MTRSLDLLAVGDPCTDLVFDAERLPAWDDKARGRAVGLFGGGTEANVACAAARLGWRCALFGRTGDDLYAGFLRHGLAQHGVRRSHLIRSERAASSTAIVALSPTGERAITWLPPGGIAPERRAERDRALAASRWAYTMPYDAAALAALARGCAAAGTRLAIDLERAAVQALDGDAAVAWRALLGRDDIVLMNRSGFEAAAGAAPSPDGLRALRTALRVRTLVVTLGADGALADDRDDGGAHQAAWPVADVVDTTGAGDSFNACFLVARDRGAALRWALAQAAQAAALTIGALGARGALHRLRPADAGPAAAPPPASMRPTGAAPC